MYRVYNYRVNKNNEIISCCASRWYKTREEAEKYFNRLTNADFIDEELELEYIKRNGEVVVDNY